MTREEWLRGFTALLCTDTPSASSWVTALPSFPSTAVRNGRVCDLVRDEDGRVLALISPHLSDSLEVGVTLAYLLDRYRVARTSRRLSNGQAARLSQRGWEVDGWRVSPSDRLADRLAVHVDGFVNGWGEYPAAAVAPSNVRRQTTRMLALTCHSHPDVRVRATRSQIDAGAPLCGRRWSADQVVCGRVLVEVPS